MMTSTPNQLPDNVRDALNRGQKIQAIKRLRAASGMGLKEAKDIIDRYDMGTAQTIPTGIPDPAAVAEALRNGNKIKAIRRLRKQTGLSLKEAKEMIDDIEGQDIGKNDIDTPETSNPSNKWLIIAMIVAGTLIFYFLNT